MATMYHYVVRDEEREYHAFFSNRNYEIADELEYDDEQVYAHVVAKTINYECARILAKEMNEIANRNQEWANKLISALDSVPNKSCVSIHDLIVDARVVIEEYDNLTDAGHTELKMIGEKFVYFLKNNLV